MSKRLFKKGDRLVLTREGRKVFPTREGREYAVVVRIQGRDERGVQLLSLRRGDAKNVETWAADYWRIDPMIAPRRRPGLVRG